LKPTNIDEDMLNKNLIILKKLVSNEDNDLIEIIMKNLVPNYIKNYF
jgi:hypothetical protein